jgi:kynurenine formamidase
MIEAEQMHNLTLPISAYFPVGSVFPWDSPYYAEDIATIERSRAHLFYISMGSGTGTRLRTPGFGSADGAQVREIDLESLVNREAVVLKIPKDRGEAKEVGEPWRSLLRRKPPLCPCGGRVAGCRDGGAR